MTSSCKFLLFKSNLEDEQQSIIVVYVFSISPAFLMFGLFFNRTFLAGSPFVCCMSTTQFTSLMHSILPVWFKRPVWLISWNNVHQKNSSTTITSFLWFHCSSFLYGELNNLPLSLILTMQYPISQYTASFVSTKYFFWNRTVDFLFKAVTASIDIRGTWLIANIKNEKSARCVQ